VAAAAVIRRQAPPRPGRFALIPGAATMWAVVTTGHGGYERLEHREVPVPVAGPGEVLLQVLAAGVNATDINTRLGWYSASVTTGTEGAASRADQGSAAAEPAPTPAGGRDDGGWDAPTPFPLIQGTDCCGRVVAAGARGDEHLLGRRALVRPCMRPRGFAALEMVWMASDFDGAFAQYVRVPASEVFPVECDLSDAELGALPCAYGTAENMLRRAGVSRGDRVVVTGASGGVGSAAVQLAHSRGAVVTAVASPAKADDVRAIGADEVVDGRAGIPAALAEQSADVVVDNVSGPWFGDLVAVLRRGGRYVSSGAIAGPVVSFDKRTLYLRDLTLIGCTAWEEAVFPDLVSSVERGEVRPLVAATFMLADIAAAQAEFLEKKRAGKIVLIPPPPEG
jgi:NADPH:quinone reductase-like Zn-dependent oxidoreductase